MNIDLSVGQRNTRSLLGKDMMYEPKNGMLSKYIRNHFAGKEHIKK